MKKMLLSLLLVLGSQAQAISVDWTGGYRVEYNAIKNTTLAEPSGNKNYALNYLYLQPKIIGSDGVNILSRFDIFGSDIPVYQNSQLGSFIGGGLDRGTPENGSNVTSQNSNSMGIRASQLYLNVNNEYGAMVVGRAPIEFGMGITHNQGAGEFDHWLDTKDMFAYRFIVDNISFMPILAKSYQSDFGLATTVSEQIFVLEYDNKDIGARTGVFHQTRKASDTSNDGKNAGFPGTDGTKAVGGFKSQTVNVFLERKWTSFEFRIEGSFLTGNTGVYHTNGEEIKLNSYAVATEILFPRNETKWEYGSKLGVVSGDNPETSSYEGYQLDRNYDVAMLMFNHRFGQADVIGNSVLHAQDADPKNNLSISNSADDEAIGNAMYLSPTVKYAWSEKSDLKWTATYARLMTNANNFLDFKKDLGLELDTEFIYRPRERVTWSTGLGLLFPGNAWKAGSNNFENKFTYGFVTKAAVTF